MENQNQKIAKKYISEMILIHGNDYKKVRQAILNNRINSQYGRTSNLETTYIWDELNNHFKS
jgi:hypothetical protein